MFVGSRTCAGGTACHPVLLAAGRLSLRAVGLEELRSAVMGAPGLFAPNLGSLVLDTAWSRPAWIHRPELLECRDIRVQLLVVRRRRGDTACLTASCRQESTENGRPRDEVGVVAVDDVAVSGSGRRSLQHLTVVDGAHDCPCPSTGPLLLPGPGRAPVVAPRATMEELHRRWPVFRIETACGRPDQACECSGGLLALR